MTDLGNRMQAIRNPLGRFRIALRIDNNRKTGYKAKTEKNYESNEIWGKLGTGRRANTRRLLYHLVSRESREGGYRVFRDEGRHGHVDRRGDGSRAS